jgi:hypothetical protein
VVPISPKARPGGRASHLHKSAPEPLVRFGKRFRALATTIEPDTRRIVP